MGATSRDARGRSRDYVAGVGDLETGARVPLDGQVRIGSNSKTFVAVALLPGLGESEPPPMLRAGLALAVTALLLPGVAPLVPDRPVDAWHTAAMVGAELLYGGLLGWLARLLALSLPVAGALVATLAGLARCS